MCVCVYFSADDMNSEQDDEDAAFWGCVEESDQNHDLRDDISRDVQEKALPEKSILHQLQLVVTAHIDTLHPPRLRASKDPTNASEVTSIWLQLGDSEVNNLLLQNPVTRLYNPVLRHFKVPIAKYNIQFGMFVSSPTLLPNQSCTP